MKLLYQSHSPYARKVLVLAHEAGLSDRLEVIHHETSPTRRNEDVFNLNPLGKVPILVTGDGVVLFDSDVICEYLDGLHAGAKLIPEDGALRFPALRLQAVASGVCDAGIALRWELQRRPAEVRWPIMAEGQTQKLLASYDFAEEQVDLGGSIDIGHIALATALSWVEFRHLPSFRQNRPRLCEWYDDFSNRQSMVLTHFSGDVQD